MTLNSIRPKFIKKTTVPVESFGCVMCYRVSSPRPNKSPSNSISNSNSFMRTILLGTEEKSHFSTSQKSYILITSFSKVLLNTERKLTGW